MYDYNQMDLRWMLDNLPKDAFYHRMYTYDDIAYPVKISTNLQENNTDLYIHHTDAFVSIIESIYKELIVDTNFKENKIYLITNDFNAESNIDFFAKKYNKDKINFIYINHWLYYTANQYFHDENKLNKIQQIADYRLNNDVEKTYISLNRRFATQRILLLALLDRFDLLQYGFVSNDLSHACQAIKKNLNKWNKNVFKVMTYRELTDDPAIDYENIVRASMPYIMKNHISNPIIADIFSTFDNLKNTVHMKIPSKKGQNSSSLSNINSVQNFVFDEEIDMVYANAMLDVVTESWYFYNQYMSPYDIGKGLNLISEAGISFTEKVYRPMIYRQPFIVVLPPNYLASLKKMGFKTFSPYINEDYDNETDDSKRIIMVVEELKRLSQLSKDEKRQLLLDTYPICEHNFNLIKTEYQTFLSKYSS